MGLQVVPAVGFRVRGNGDKFNFPGYPPDKQVKATQTVLERIQLLALDWAA